MSPGMRRTMKSNENWHSESHTAFDALAPFYERHWGESFFRTSTELFNALVAGAWRPGLVSSISVAAPEGSQGGCTARVCKSAGLTTQPAC